MKDLQPERPVDVVFTFSFVTWDGACERGMHFPEDRLVERLIGHPRVRGLMIANPYRAGARLAARRLMRRERPRPSGSGRTLFSPVRMRRGDPADLARIERRYASYDRALEEACDRAGLHRPTVITTHPLVAGWAPLTWAGRVTYYATDDWAAHPDYAPLRTGILEAYRRIRMSGRQVCAVSSHLLERIRPQAPSRVIPNGVNTADWIVPAEPPAWLAALPRPRFVYLGTLDSRIDIDQVRATAARHPDGSVVLVGPVGDRAHLAPLCGVANVHLRAPEPHERVPGVLAGAEVCLLPHRRTALTESMSPLKLVEYLAAGRPVVATDLAPVRALGSPRVVLVADGEDFAQHAGDALALGPATEDARLRALREHGWDRAHEALIEMALGASRTAGTRPLEAVAP